MEIFVQEVGILIGDCLVGGIVDDYWIEQVVFFYQVDQVVKIKWFFCFCQFCILVFQIQVMYVGQQCLRIGYIVDVQIDMFVFQLFLLVFDLFQQCVVDVVDVDDKYFNYLVGVEQYLMGYVYVGGGVVIVDYY